MKFCYETLVAIQDDFKLALAPFFEREDGFSDRDKSGSDLDCLAFWLSIGEIGSGSWWCTYCDNLYHICYGNSITPYKMAQGFHLDLMMENICALAVYWPQV